MPEAHRNSNRDGGVFPQALVSKKCAKCSSLLSEACGRCTVPGAVEGLFAGRYRQLSTGMSTPVQNVQNHGTRRPHTAAFLLKMGKVMFRRGSVGLASRPAGCAIRRTGGLEAAGVSVGCRVRGSRGAREGEKDGREAGLTPRERRRGCRGHPKSRSAGLREGVESPEVDDAE